MSNEIDILFEITWNSLTYSMANTAAIWKRREREEKKIIYILNRQYRGINISK